MLVNQDGLGSSNYDAAFSMPTNDFRVLDLFHWTAITRLCIEGPESVNQTTWLPGRPYFSGVI